MPDATVYKSINQVSLFKSGIAGSPGLVKNPELPSSFILVGYTNIIFLCLSYDIIWEILLGHSRICIRTYFRNLEKISYCIFYVSIPIYNVNHWFCILQITNNLVNKIWNSLCTKINLKLYYIDASTRWALEIFPTLKIENRV
jgi:hypothetical protein